MKTINSFRSKLFAFTLALMASVSTFAYDFQSGYLFYNILPDRTVAVTSETYGIPYDYLPTSLVIPSEVSDYYGATYQVSEIANGAFQGCDELESVIIPNTVKKIGMYAFTGCSKLIDISFPESLEDVMGGALYDCAWYDNQPDGLIYVGNLLYRYKGTAPAGTIEVREGTKAILDLAFSQQSNIQSVVLPSSVTSVHLRAFANCANLETIVLPDSLSVIDDEAFTNCVKLTAIKLPQILSIIGEGAFSGCSNLSQIEWPQHMISIGASAFYECTQLDNVEAIPASIQKIGANAFYNTAWENRQPAGYLYIHNIFYAYTGELTENLHINIKHGTTYISGGAVSRCWLTNGRYRENIVTKLTIPTTVKEIEDRTFASCNKLDTIICAADMVPVIGENTFSTKTYENSKLLVFDYLLTYYQYGDFWRNFVNIQPITDYSSFNPKTFMSDGFYYNIINDTIAPFEVEITYTWGAGSSFNTKNYTELTTLHVPSIVEYQGVVYNVTRIGKQAFYGAQKLQHVTMSESIKTIDSFAFMNCPQLTEVQIGESVDSILLDAFGFCKLQQLTIPKNVKYIAPLIVRKNPITSINVHPENSNYTSIDGVLFNKNENILHTFPAAYATRYTIPESVDTIGSCAFAGTSIESVIFPKNLVCIANEAFTGTNLTELILPASLQSIGMYAFDMCSNLKEVICHATTPPIMSDGESEYKYHVFMRVPVSDIPLYVPAESIEAYKNADQWKDFGQILPIEPTSYKSQWCDTWNMLVQTGSVYPPSSTPYRYQLAKDTIIGDYTYTAIVSKAINDALDAPHYVAAVRFTDDRKVYIYYDNAEYLLYDFNVQQGDELEVFAGINNYTSEIKTYKCTVTGVEQYACVGCPAAITLEVHNHPNDFREFYRETQWIEGVGDINGFLNGINHYVEVDGGGSEYLLCAYKGDELKYTGDLYEEYGCGDDAEQSPEDLFPTLWGLQRTSCTKTIGEDEEGTVHGLRSTLMEVKQDMIIDGKQYVLFGEGHNYDSFLLREKGNKVFVYSSLLRKDLVLYDYTLEVGDSLPALYIDWQYHDAFHQPLPYNGEVVDYNKDYDGTILPADTFIVTNISTITLLDGKEHKKWTFNNGMQYVEGIGSYGTSYAENDFYQLIANIPQYSDADSTFLVCVSKNNKLLYQMDDAEMERLGAECLCDVETSYKDQWCDTWNIMSFDGMVFESSVETDQYKLAQDTIIGEYVYTALTRQPTSSGTNPTSYVAAVRFTEDKKVYIFYDNTEYLLYDFDVQVGDVLETFVGINHYGPWNTCYYAVTGIEEIPEDGTKKIHLEAYVIDDEAESFVIETTWIEGVGSTDGFVMSPLGLGGIVGNSNYKLLCAYKDNELEYTSTWYNEYGCQCNANEINDSFYPTLAGLQRTSFYEHGEDCSANYAQLMISNRTMRIGSNYYLRFDDTPYGTLFLREYHNRVFVYSFADQRDLILYDWNLQVGDSMTYRSIDNYSYPDSEYPVVVNYMARSHSDGTITKEPLGKIYVTNISTVTLLDGNEYKKWTFNNGMEYIQGLGCMDGNYFSLIIPEAVPTCYRADHLVCASKNGQLLYQMDDAEMERLGAECLCDIETSYKDQWCNQWNVLTFDGWSFDETARTSQYRLGKDTVIGDYTYSKFTSRTSVRFTSDRKVYVYYEGFDDNDPYTPDLPTGEYLAYDFSAQVGDTLEVFSGIGRYSTLHCIVVDVLTNPETNLRTITLMAMCDYGEGDVFEGGEIIWLEGVGSPVHGFLMETPSACGWVGAYTNILLCAYKDDELKYTGDSYDTYGCEYNAGVVSEDHFPMLAGLSRTICKEYYSSDVENNSQNNTYLQEFTTPILGAGHLYLYYENMLIREEDDKILIVSRTLDKLEPKEFVLYDFTLQVGDSLPMLYIDYYDNGSWIPNYELLNVVDYRRDEDGTKHPADILIVTDVSMITLSDGKEYKKWTFNNGMEYVEGIGSFGNDQWSGDFFQLIANKGVPTSLLGEHLVCVSKNNKLLYMMDDAEMERLDAECLCEYNSGPRRDNAKNGKIGGRPTPTQWNMLEVVLQETEVGNTIMSAETFSYTLENDSLVVDDKTYYQLARQSTKDTATTKSFVGALHFGEGEDNRVYFLHNGVEYVLYDFTAEPGDTVEIFAGINNYPHDSVYTHVVTGKDTLENGACRMLLEVVFPEETNATATHAEKVWLAGLGSIDGIVHNAAKRTSNAHAAPSRSASSSEAQTSVMLCAWREDSCLYTTDHPDYNELGCEYNQDPTAVEDIYIPQTTYKKIIRNGQLLIIHEDKTYNVMGIEVK